MSASIMPPSICLEATTVCQLACPSCYTATGELHALNHRGFVTAERFRAVLDANPGIRHVELSNNGEMFLNRDLLSIMELAQERGIRLSAANGVNMNFVRPEVLEGLVKHGFFGLTVSIDGASQATYEQYRRKGSYEQVLANIRAVNEHKAQYASDLPHMVWQFIVFGHNEHEMVAAAMQARRLGMSIRFKLQWDDDHFPPQNKEALTRIVGASSRQEYLERTGVSYMRPICHQMWNLPVFNWDGRLFGCCKNSWDDYGVNIFEDGLEGALGSERYSYAKDMIQGKVPAREDIPCTRCPEYETLTRTGRWITPDELGAG